MAAATSDGMEGVIEVSLSEIEEALTYSVARALCEAATAKEFLPDACAQAAKAYKHNAFATRLDRHTTAVQRVSSALKKAERQICLKLAASPAAEQFVDTTGTNEEPTFTAPTTPSGKGIFKTKKGTIRSSQATNMALLWTLRYSVDYFGMHACSLAEQQNDSYEAIAKSLASTLTQTLPKTAESLRQALDSVEVDLAPPAKKAKF